ncbi:MULTISPECIES: type VI secretion system baseplate subunit TssE [Pseudomonas]|uniref:type VI secretion system baseplate subunit TssE n=1 Tax=Pseudomonas TaxID=286 RepID=UPI00235EF12E|nr:MULTISPECIES: type VI secretion system baseplate subunit TssE [Pseudomonas]WJV25567.1 type VI secretion system baseplate subunit TssE [Pseudomonas chlororaphis]
MPRSPGRGSLFERLEPDLPPRRTRSSHELAGESVQAIKRQLEWVLNTRRGSSQSCPELGVADLNDATISSADLQQKICEDIRATVIRYVPRIHDVDVHPLSEGSSQFGLRIRLNCLVRTKNTQEQIQLDLLLREAGRIAKVS